MTFQMLLSVILITLALVFYTVGVWSERIAGRLKGWHLAFFWAGFVCDTTGTGIMMEMSGGNLFNILGLTCLIAIILMLIHAVWASFVLARNDEKAILNFHKALAAFNLFTHESLLDLRAFIIGE